MSAVLVIKHKFIILSTLRNELFPLTQENLRDIKFKLIIYLKFYPLITNQLRILFKITYKQLLENLAKFTAKHESIESLLLK